MATRNRANSSYRQIIKSTTIIGGSSGINILLRIIRTKFLAVLLGPSGIGLIGIYTSVINIFVTLAGMGIDSSGVRQISESSSTGNEEKIARTNLALRRVTLFLGLFGTIIFVLFNSYIWQLTFQNTEYDAEVIFLSIIILLEIVMLGRVAIIQGMRRIGDLGKLNILGALYGTILSIPIIYIWGQKGIIPFLIAASAMSILTAWWYARKIKVTSVSMDWAQIWTEVNPLLKLGIAIMGSVLMSKATMYILRVLVVRSLGLEAVGLYLASTTLSYIYVGFIIDSMIKDYLPRLTSVAKDNAACNKLVNEQVEVGVLIAVPGVLATLTFAPLIIQLFYSTKFIAAYEILRWQVLGCLLQIVIAPLGLILQAKGLGRMYFMTSFLTNGIHVCLIWAGISYFGLNGTGIAFLGRCAFYLIILYFIARRLTGFSWSGINTQIALWAILAVGVVFVSGIYLEPLWGLILGIVITLAMTFFSVRSLVNILSPDGFLPLLAKIKRRLTG